MIWYHVSRDWSAAELIVEPRPVRSDDDAEPRNLRPCVCVCPTVRQAIEACSPAEFDLPEYRVYRAESDRAEPATWVFDFERTGEHRLYEPTRFVHVRTLTRDEVVLSFLGVEEAK